MRYFHIFFLLIAFQSVAFSSFLLDKNTPVCVEDYYFQDGRIYFQKSSNLNWGSTAEDHSASRVFDGYIYDSNNDTCLPELNNFDCNGYIDNSTGLYEPYCASKMLNIDIKDYSFIMALLGGLLGLTFLSSIIFILFHIGKTYKV